MANPSLWVGLDVGADTSRMCALDADLRKVVDRTVDSTAPAVIEALSPFGPSDLHEVAVESCAFSTHLVRRLRQAGFPVVVYHAGRVSKYLRVRNNKTDTNDARGLAELAKLGLPAVRRVHVKNPETQRLRSKLLFRHNLTRHRVAWEGMIRSLLRLHGGRLPHISSPERLQRLVCEQLDDLGQGSSAELATEVLPLLTLCVSLRRYLQQIESELIEFAEQDPVCSRLMTVPSVGPICALSFYTAIEDPSRFSRAADVGAYLGLTPRVLQSGQSLKHGRISRSGNKLTRAHLGMSAAVLLAGRIHDFPLKEWGLRLAERAGRGKAKVAIARKLAVVMLAMWKNESSFNPEFAR